MTLDRSSGRLQIFEQYVVSVDLRRFMRAKLSFYAHWKVNAGIVEEDISIGVEHLDTFDSDRGVPTEVTKNVGSSVQFVACYTRKMTPPADKGAAVNLAVIVDAGGLYQAGGQQQS